MPKVSVCIPTYQPTTFLQEAVQSVLDQSFTDFELILVDDCSSMDVENWLKQFIVDVRLTFFRNERNLGLAGNWNRCIELAQGEYLAIFHQDDRMYPANLALKCDLLDRYQEVGLVYSDIRTIDENSAEIGGHYTPQPKENSIFSGADLYRMTAEQGNPIACQTVIARKECFRRLGGFNENLDYATDLEMWLRIARDYSIGFLSQALVARRVHNKQKTRQFFGNGKDYLEVLQAYDIVFSQALPEGYKSSGKIAYQTLSRQAFSMAKYCLRSARFGSAFTYTQVFLDAKRRAASHDN